MKVYQYHYGYIWDNLRAYQDIIIAKTNKRAGRSSLLGFACKTVVRRRPKMKEKNDHRELLEIPPKD